MESEEGTIVLTKRTTFVVEELEVIFKYIPSTKLLAFRKVSKEWDEAAKLTLRKRYDVKLLLLTDNFDSRFNSKFLQFLNDSPENVFVAPVIHILNTNKSQGYLEEGRTCISFDITREICQRLGNRGIIQKLILEDGDKAPHFTSGFISTLLGHLSSSLETLEISKLMFYSAMTSERNNPNPLPSLKQINFCYAYGCAVKEAGNLLKIILESSPNLEHIAGDPCNLQELNIISILSDTERLSKIKEITLRKSADLDILLQCKPKMVLHSFKIASEDVVDSKKLFIFLQQQAANLKSLQCDEKSLIPKSLFTLPVLPVLEKLTFNHCKGGSLLSVNYGKHTPKLKSLWISSAKNFHTWEEFLFYEISSERPPCLSLEEMELFIDGKSYQRMFDNLKNLFPNVKRLTIDYPEKFDFDQVSKCWPNLEELKTTVHTGYNKDYEHKDLDAILFGISPAWKKGIDTTEEWMNSPHEITRTLANFKNLQKLEVPVQGFGGAAYLTDFAVYFGLKHMQNLKELFITTTFHDIVMEDVSAEAFNFLVKNLPKLERVYLAEKKWERGEILK